MVQLERLLYGFCRANVLWNLSLLRRIQITLKRRLPFSTDLRGYKLFKPDTLDINKHYVAGLVELNILKNLTVYVVAGSLGRFKSHASNIVFDEHSENILPSSDGDVGLIATSGPSVLGDKVDEECAAADPPEISDAQNNRKCCRE
ncbi:unnamed protein product [Brassica oleracea var. botrytis]|uniref:(rape) hypothetical protein n=1 Tax=Brassica napus TaxID=3708 RepID=A0A078FM76_BRANA|nr:unnamed protein product [Brassica napus]CDY13999.1 BnaC09g38270D [Brassica napus]